MDKCMSNLWATSVVASRDRLDGSRFLREVRHAVAVIRAGSRAEAMGLALLMVRKTYPSAEGWQGHDVVVHDCGDVVDPEHFTVTPA